MSKSKSLTINALLALGLYLVIFGIGFVFNIKLIEWIAYGYLFALLAMCVIYFFGTAFFNMDFEEIKRKIKERRTRLDTPGYNRGTIQQLHDAWLITKIEEGEKCKRCGKGDEAILSVDHIVPKFIIKEFGLDPDFIFDEDNLQVLCKRCNTFKASRMDFSDPRVKQLLIKYVNMIQ